MNIIFNSSLPRSGSTLLQNLLLQSNSNYCSSTNSLLDMIVQVRNTYSEFEGFKSQGLNKITPRIKNMMNGMIRGFYQEELSSGKNIIDKSRAYLAYIELIEEILERPIKIICCVRDIKEIVASFERLYRTNQLTKIDSSSEYYFSCQTIEGRMMNLLAPGASLGTSLSRLGDVFERGLDDRLIIVPYSKLVSDTVSTIVKISTASGLQPFICDPTNVEQKLQEDDSVYGMELHAIRNKVNFNGSTNWRDFLPERLGEYIDNTFPFFQKLANIGN